MFLDCFALGVLVFVVVTLSYAVIEIHDIPQLMAKARNHPHEAAIRREDRSWEASIVSPPAI